MAELILTSIFLIVFILFLMYNADYTTSVSLIFVKYDNVSIHLIVLFAFLTGILFSLFVLIVKVIKKKSQKRRIE